MRIIKKKCSFILLEALIGIALVALFAIPLVSFPIWQCKEEINSLKTLELEKIANRIYAENLEGLYKNEISWIEMEKRIAPRKIIQVPSETIFYNGKNEKIDIRLYRWSTKCPKFEYKNSLNTLHFINLKIVMKADFLPLEKKELSSSSRKPKRIKTFVYKVLAKNIVQKN